MLDLLLYISCPVQRCSVYSIFKTTYLGVPSEQRRLAEHTMLAIIHAIVCLFCLLFCHQSTIQSFEPNPVSTLLLFPIVAGGWPAETWPQARDQLAVKPGIDAQQHQERIERVARSTGHTNLQYRG